MSPENGDKTDQDVISLEQEKIYRLSPDTVIVGLGHIINEVRIDLIKTLLESPLPEIEQYQLEALDAVNSLLDPLEYSEKQDEYKEAFARVLKYLRFLGFAESDLTAEGIRAAEDSVNLALDPKRQLRESKVIDLDLQRHFRQAEKRPPNAATPEQLKASPIYQFLLSHNEFLSQRVKQLEERVDNLLGIKKPDHATILSEMDAWIEFLENLFPGKIFTFKEILAGNQKLLDAIMNPNKEIT